MNWRALRKNVLTDILGCAFHLCSRAAEFFCMRPNIIKKTSLSSTWASDARYPEMKVSFEYTDQLYSSKHLQNSTFCLRSLTSDVIGANEIEDYIKKRWWIFRIFSTRIFFNSIVFIQRMLLDVLIVDWVSDYRAGGRGLEHWPVKHSRSSSWLLGSLSNHDDDGSENVIWKCHFAFLLSLFNYSMSLYYVWKMCSNYNGIKLEPALGT